MTESAWRKDYEAALLEVDLRKLAARVRAAEDAIRARAASLNGPTPVDELLAIEDALNDLNLLKRIKEE
ncbi:MAG TPA: hypothetical protein VN881_06345 [Candidatus Acidoferrales bacterium]|jgi:hypothetical protein|nr:hypothetical protein [Candidatus Acidoferrales bacterium]